MHLTDDRLTLEGVAAEPGTSPHGTTLARSRGHHVKDLGPKTLPMA